MYRDGPRLGQAGRRESGAKRDQHEPEYGHHHGALRSDGFTTDGNSEHPYRPSTPGYFCLCFHRNSIDPRDHE